MSAYLFDFNGVLVDDERVHFSTMRDVIAPLGATLDEATYFEKYLAGDDVSCFRAMLADAGLPHDDALLRACVEQKLELYMRAIDRDLVVFEGAFDLVRACAAVGDVAIVSGALRVEIEKIAEKMGVREVLRTIVAAEDVTTAKPHPAGYVEALRRLGVQPHDAIVVEDSIGGIEAGVAAGCSVVAVAHSLSVERLRATRARLVVDRIGALDVDKLDAARTAR